MDHNKNASPRKKEAIERRRCDGDRRKIPSQGFTRISVVGWICRREQTRRKGDKMECFYTDEW